MLTSAVYASESFIADGKSVDVVAAATNATPAPAPATKPTPAPAAKPTTTTPATATATQISRLLAYGSRGADVKLLQTLLVNNGYTLAIDGIFGNQTQKAVKDYQSKNGLKVDGIVGPKTLGKLNATAAPSKLTISNANDSIQNKTFKGDVYVRAANFQLVNAVVDGNIYFVTQEAKDTFKMDAGSKVTGDQILADVDAVSTASLVNDVAAFEKAISKDGTWIVCPLRDLTTDKALVVEGTFYDKNDTTKALKRKIGLYTHNDPNDKKKATHSFTLTAPSLTIKSPSTTLQYGTFVGDIYVRADNFNLTNTKVDGNIYFVTQSAKDTFTNTNSTVTGELILADVDAVSTASIVSDAAAFEKAISKDGTWIITTLRDLVIDKELVVEGTFHDKNDPAKDLKRKIGLYTHNNPENKKIATHSFTLTVPKLTVKSPNTTLQYGTFIGDIYVESNNFNITNTKVDGNIYFATQEAMDSFTNVNSEVTGVIELKTN
jgi:peptidoglycan hydrolase-like protein with peptidoglycan-binding domain